MLTSAVVRDLLYVLNVHVLHITGFMSFMNMTNKKWIEEDSSGKSVSTVFSGEKIE